MLKTHQNCNGSVKGGRGVQGKNFPLAFHSDFAGMFGWGRLGLGKTSIANEGFNSGIAQISLTPPTPQFGHLGPFFPADKNDVLRV